MSNVSPITIVEPDISVLEKLVRDAQVTLNVDLETTVTSPLLSARLDADPTVDACPQVLSVSITIASNV